MHRDTCKMAGINIASMPYATGERLPAFEWTDLVLEAVTRDGQELTLRIAATEQPEGARGPMLFELEYAGANVCGAGGGGVFANVPSATAYDLTYTCVSPNDGGFGVRGDSQFRFSGRGGEECPGRGSPVVERTAKGIID